MENFYVLVVGLLFILAIFDLVVGVSNDAVNFLNSAIGSRVAKRRTIMIIASVGILLGAVSSGGMMEVARKGIFTPEHFYFNEIMVLFLAVMITDIILLDLFNTFAMPTSTTVSIVFEILGAALALSVVKTLQTGAPMNYIFNANDPENGVIGYMNWGKAGEIVLGIVLSVIIAFTIGALVMYVARFFFSFNYQRKIKHAGVIWSGVAFTAITYFLLFKGLGAIIKGVDEADMNVAQLAYKHFNDWVKANLWQFLALAFLVWSVVMFVLEKFKINPIRLVVLFGTFSLAMAFAGNDLVNFIGVPIAGWQSFEAWQGSGVLPSEFKMDVMQGKVATPYLFLIGAGVIMTLTLWFSKKAQSVTETEVKLGAQSETSERFQANAISRIIVRGGSLMNEVFSGVLPNGVKSKIAKSFEPLPLADVEENIPAFDLVRASVNLVVASVLIAIATGMKLPLSTTYVSFMVAMGTSLADRAWGRESAVYRVAGVLNVIGGWFLTAIIASSVAGVFAVFMYFGEYWAILTLVLLVGFVIFKTSKLHASKQNKEKRSQERSSINYQDVNDTLNHLTEHLAYSFSELIQCLDYTEKGLKKEDKKKVKKALKIYDSLQEDYAMVKEGLYKIIKKNKSDETTSAHIYVLTYDLMQDLLQSLELIVRSVDTHVRNNHKPLKEDQMEKLTEVFEQVKEYIVFIQNNLENNNLLIVDEAKARNVAFQRMIEEVMGYQIQGVMDKTYGFKNTSLYFTLLLELKDLSAVSLRFLKLYGRIMAQGKLTK